MEILKLKHLIRIVTFIFLGTGVIVYVNAKQETNHVDKLILEDQVHVQFDNNQNPIPIPSDQLEERMFPVESNPYSCPSGSGEICSATYSPSDLEQNTNGDWVPKASATPTSTRLYN